MKNLGYFEKYVPDNLDPVLAEMGVRHCQNEDCADWYVLSGHLGTVVVLGDGGEVTCVAEDATSTFPENAQVIELEDGDPVPEFGMVWDGTAFVDHAPTQDEYTAAIQAALDAPAKERSYTDGNTMATYVNSTNATWAAEAQSFVAWRDAVWEYAYAQLAAVLAGEREQPTIDELLAELPEAVWPE